MVLIYLNAPAIFANIFPSITFFVWLEIWNII